MTVATCTTYTSLKFVLHAFIYCVFVACVCEHMWPHVCGYMWKPKAAIRSLPSTLYIEAGSLSTEPRLPSWTQLISPVCLLRGPYSAPSLHWNYREVTTPPSIYVGPGASSWSLTLGQQASYPWSHLSNPCMACLHFYLLKHTHEGSTQQGPTVSRIKVRGRHSQALTLPTTPIRGSL